MKCIPVVIAVILNLVVISHAHAHDEAGRHCSVDLKSEILISPEFVTIRRDNNDELVINRDNELFVNDKPIKLSPSQQKLIEDYARQARETIPVVVDIALQGVEIALSTLTEVYYALVDIEPPADLMAAMNGISESVQEKLGKEGDSVYLHAVSFKGLEDAMEEFEPVMEEAMATAMSEVMVSFGQMMKGGDWLAKIGALSTRLENMGDEIADKMSGKMELLGQKAEGLCDAMKALDETESELQNELPQLRAFELVIVNQRGI